MSKLFTLRNLSVISYCNGFTHWHYRGNFASALEGGFFSDARDLIAFGDMITVSDETSCGIIFASHDEGRNMVMRPLLAV